MIYYILIFHILVGIGNAYEMSKFNPSHNTIFADIMFFIADVVIWPIQFGKSISRKL